MAALVPACALPFGYLPEFIRVQLLLDRDPCGSVQVAKTVTEKYISALLATISTAFEASAEAFGYLIEFIRVQFWLLVLHRPPLWNAGAARLRCIDHEVRGHSGH